nr:MAG TPA: hypothetical protein [Caudoviricetes sp.]DAU41485.1 MAG TPA: hypothetical protein [Bacteriophage sp.]
MCSGCVSILSLFFSKIRGQIYRSLIFSHQFPMIIHIYVLFPYITFLSVFI